MFSFPRQTARMMRHRLSLANEASLGLAPRIQEHILNMPNSTGRLPFSEQRLRPLTMFDQHRQFQAFADLVPK